MKTNKRGGIAFPATVGFTVGVGATAIRAFQENLGTWPGLVAGVALSATVGIVAAITVQFFVTRFSKPAK